MKTKRVIPRERANQDADEAVAYYLGEGADDAAIGFIDALERAYAHIARHPETGSPRHGHELNLSGLRTRPLRRFPYLVFYVDLPDRVDIWRVHSERDVPAWMREPGTF